MRPTLSEPVTVKLTVPDTTALFAGEVMDIDGAVVSGLVTLIVED